MFIVTQSGIRLYPDKPDRALIDIRDISYSLARIARYNGHCPFYSDALHSVVVSWIVERHLNGTIHEQLWGLLHDGPEYILGDVVGPLKKLPIMAGYRELERRWEIEFAAAFGLDEDMPPIVKKADRLALVLEKYTFVHPNARKDDETFDSMLMHGLYLAVGDLNELRESNENFDWTEGLFLARFGQLALARSYKS